VRTRRPLAVLGAALGPALLAAAGWEPVSGPLFTAHRLTAPASFSANAEGPEFTRTGRLFVVNCERDGTVCEVHPDGRVEVFVTLPAGSTANAIREDSRGGLLLADFEGHNVLRLDVGSRRVSVWVHDARFSQPNDLATSRRDVVYASDPDWARGTGRVWRIAADGKAVGGGASPAAAPRVSLLAGDLGTANGIALSPDERTLYVAESVQRRILAFALDADGQAAGAPRVLATFPDHGLDGIKCDASGRLFVTRHGKGTVAILDRAGRVEREVQMPGRSVSNVVFGGPDGRRVFVTLQDTKDMHWFATDVPGAPTR
jgi:sugar lactone lactonase YvrE